MQYKYVINRYHHIYIYMILSSIQYCSMIRLLIVILIGVGILEENEELQATCTLQSVGHQAAWSLAAPGQLHACSSTQRP